MKPGQPSSSANSAKALLTSMASAGRAIFSPFGNRKVLVGDQDVQLHVVVLLAHAREGDRRLPQGPARRLAAAPLPMVDRLADLGPESPDGRPRPARSPLVHVRVPRLQEERLLRQRRRGDDDALLLAGGSGGEPGEQARVRHGGDVRDRGSGRERDPGKRVGHAEDGAPGPPEHALLIDVRGGAAAHQAGRPRYPRGESGRAAVREAQRAQNPAADVVQQRRAGHVRDVPAAARQAGVARALEEDVGGQQAPRQAAGHDVQLPDADPADDRHEALDGRGAGAPPSTAAARHHRVAEGAGVAPAEVGEAPVPLRAQASTGTRGAGRPAPGRCRRRRRRC